ncbi:hypothetical protein HDU76_003371 [Blyttiomyces sp. JEL0837]|nr:hypothetical protein HDU76_003371 [Blyttiomyces sp. JEL0837]
MTITFICLSLLLLIPPTLGMKFSFRNSNSNRTGNNDKITDQQQNTHDQGRIVVGKRPIPVGGQIESMNQTIDEWSGKDQQQRVLQKRSGGPPDANNQCQTVYVVMEGDDCDGICQRVGISRSDLLRYNPRFDCGSIYATETICISPPCYNCNSHPANLGCQVLYIIKKGDTCWKIATAFDITIKYLQCINPSLNCDDDPIYPRQALCVRGPVSGDGSLAYPYPPLQTFS